jgi:hypothetical protein
MSTNIFDIKEVLTAGWEGFKKNAVLLIVLPLALVVVSVLIYAFGMLFMMVLPFLIVLLPIVALIEGILSVYVLFCLVTASLAIVRGETPSWEILKIDIASFIRFLVVFLIVAIATAIVSSAVSFIFPAILGANAASLLLVTLLLSVLTVAVTTLFFPAQYIVIDKKEVSIIDALKNSWSMTFPRAVPCLIFILVCFVINFIGSIPLGLGLIITMPVTLISAACVYKKLDSADSVTAAVAQSSEPADAAEK